MRWGTGYAFTAAGVLDPPRDPTNPTDRLNLNQGRDMVKADYVHGPHAFSFAWSTAALAPTASNLHDTTAFRYNVLVHGFDTSLIAGDDRGGDSFGALTFTRVLGQAWELHGEAAWREQAAVLIGAKYTTPQWRHLHRRVLHSAEHSLLSRHDRISARWPPTLCVPQRR